jgi:hypothetical protein
VGKDSHVQVSVVTWNILEQFLSLEFKRLKKNEIKKLYGEDIASGLL